MAKTFNQMVAEAMAGVPAVSPAEAQEQIQQEPDTLVVDVRDAADIPSTGIIPGAIHVSLGTLGFKADNEVPEGWREPELQDRSRPILVACQIGPMSALGAKLLKDMGFTNVRFIEGGTEGWQDAGLPTEPFNRA